MTGGRKLLAASLMTLGLAAGTAQADVGVGIGLSWVFGANSGASSAALGLKVFSTRQRNKAAASVGVDYLFADSVLRPNIGVAHIGRNIFVDANIGYNPRHNAVDFGLGLGGVNSRKRAAVPPPAPVPGGG